MILDTVPAAVWLVAGIALLVVGASAVVFLEMDGRDGISSRTLGRYLRWLDAKLRFVRSPATAARIALLQAVTAAAALAGALTTREPLVLLGGVIACVLPAFVMEKRCERRVAELEAQLDGWLLVLANALKSTPAIGDAIAESGALVGPPLRDELDLVTKEQRLGTPLDQALSHLSARVASPAMSSALASLVIARQTGGDLPRMLEETASALREITRLEGVLRAKTSEARSQAYVMSAIPFLLIGAIHAVDPEWLAPLAQSALGLGITGTAVALWVVAILFARRVLSVQL